MKRLIGAILAIAAVLTACQVTAPPPPAQEPQGPQADKLHVKIDGPDLILAGGGGAGRFKAMVGGTMMEEDDVTYLWTHEGQGTVVNERMDRWYLYVQARGGIGDRGLAVVRVTVTSGGYTAKASHTFRFW